MSNFREYEIMVPAMDTSDITNKIKSLGAKLTKQALQIDEYFDFIPLKFSRKDELCRIRSEFTQDSKEFIAGEFSWKSGRRGTSENYEVRDDISQSIDTENNVNSLREILYKLGLERLAKLEKVRDRWLMTFLDRKVEFEFDKSIHATGLKKPRKNIGGFLQATIETSENISDEKIIEVLWQVLQKLGYSRKDFEPRSYIEIYLNIEKPYHLK